MIDFHSHCLPGIDDGATNVNMSLAMLKDSKKQGVNTVLATPHFYPDGRTIEGYINARTNAYNILIDEMEKSVGDYPEIVLGTEVKLGYSLMDFDSLDLLCVEGTRYILLEMPYTKWDSSLYDLIYSISIKYKVKPVIAHIERYTDMNKDMEYYNQLFSMDVYVQANAEGFLGFSSARFLSKLIKAGNVHVIGSDMHNMTDRKCCMAQAAKKIEKKYGRGLLEFFENNAASIIDNKNIIVQ